MHIVVNLAPSSLKKVGSGFDLPIAIGICWRQDRFRAIQSGHGSVWESCRWMFGTSGSRLLAYERLAQTRFGSLSAPIVDSRR